MLTEDERARIRAEEIFRHEVRRELEASGARPSRRKQFWLLLNSSFTIWALSSVVVASLTAAFTAHQRSHAEQLQKAEIVRRLDTEISNRIVNALIGSHIEKGQIGKATWAYTPQWIYNDTVSYLDNFFRTNAQNPRDFSIFPEYRDRTFPSLILELSRVVDRSALPELREALAGYEKLATVASDCSKEAMTKDKSKVLNAVTDSMEILNREVMKPRWQPRM